jgi:ABC-type lipoprotein release transport system permease subunit
MTASVFRHARIIGYAVRSLLRRWQKNVAVVAVYALVIFMLASVVFLTESLSREAVAVLGHAPEIIVQKLSAGRHGLTHVADLAPLTRIVGVWSGRPRLWAHYVDPSTNETLVLIVPAETPLRDTQITAGRELLRRRSISAGGTLALRTHTGDWKTLEVAAVAEASTALESVAQLNVSEATFREVTGMPFGLATDIVLSVRNAKEVATVAKKIQRAWPDTRPVIREELVRTYRSVLNWRSGVIVVVLLVPGLSFVIFAWDKAAGLSPDERREIGILKAIGWETEDVIVMKCYEAAAVSCTAFALGAGLAIAAVGLRWPLVVPALTGWSTLYPSFRAMPAVGAYQVAMLFLLAVVPYLVATVVPSWRAATIDPDLVMRT